MKTRYLIHLLTLFSLLIGSVLMPALEAEVSAAQSAGFELTERDGTKVVLARIPRRVVVLSRSTVDILWHLGIKPAGVMSSRSLPPELRGIPVVGLGMRPDLEKIKALNPDLVIGLFDFKATLKPIFTEHRIPVYFIDDQRYTDTLSAIVKLGAAFDRRERAEGLLADLKTREERLLARLAGEPAPRVMIIFGTADSFMLAGERSYAGDLVKRLGGINITGMMREMGSPVSGYIPFSMENVVALNPEIILRISHGNPEATQAIFRKEFEANPVWRQLDAVVKQRVYDLDPELFFANPGLKCSDALEYLAELMYPVAEIRGAGR